MSVQLFRIMGVARVKEALRQGVFPAAQAEKARVWIQDAISFEKLIWTRVTAVAGLITVAVTITACVLNAS